MRRVERGLQAIAVRMHWLCGGGVGDPLAAWKNPCCGLQVIDAKRSFGFRQGLVKIRVAGGQAS
jgi:hypothetical protein